MLLKQSHPKRCQATARQKRPEQRNPAKRQRGLHMVGPALHHEMMPGSRRSRAYVFRWLYGGWLVLQVLWFYLEYGMTVLVGDTSSYATPVVAGWFVQTFVVQQLLFLVLATPVLTAGAITDEKT